LAVPLSEAESESVPESALVMEMETAQVQAAQR
jgi:hypothetical protein